MARATKYERAKMTEDPQVRANRLRHHAEMARLYERIKGSIYLDNSIKMEVKPKEAK